MEDMLDYNVAPKEIQQTQARNFIQRVEHNTPIHLRRIQRWSNTPLGRYAIYTAAIYIFPQKKVKAAIRAVRQAHGAYESIKTLLE